MNRVTTQLVGDKEVMRQIKKLDDRVRKNVLKKAARKGLKPAAEAYKRTIKDADEPFKVYRNGKVYAEIQPGQLQKSVGVKFKRMKRGDQFLVASVGPRKVGAFKSPEKGGWYAAFISFGWLSTGAGKYKGQNYGFAERAINLGDRIATPKIKSEFTKLLRAEIKKLSFTQLKGFKK